MLQFSIALTDNNVRQHQLHLQFKCMPRWLSQLKCLGTVDLHSMIRLLIACSQGGECHALGVSGPGILTDLGGGGARYSCGRLCGVPSQVVCCREHLPTTLLSQKCHERVHGLDMWCI